MPTRSVSRRGFVAGGFAALGAAWTVQRAGGQDEPATQPEPADPGEAAANPVCAFTKFLQPLTYDQMAQCVARLGFDGVEATVRARGHVLPERVEDDLPRLMEALAKHGLQMTIMTSDVSRADQPHAERVLRTAAALGVKRYRMGYYTYDLDRPVKTQRDELRPVVRDLAALNRELGIQGLYQNHAGAKYVGATVWDFQSLIDEIPLAEIGFAFDIRHAAVEAGLAWRVLQNVAAPHLGAICVKDFRWENGKPENVPLGEGQVDRGFFRRVKQDGFRGPVSLHVEYLEQAGVEPNIEALGRDLATLRNWIAAA